MPFPFLAGGKASAFFIYCVQTFGAQRTYRIDKDHKEQKRRVGYSVAASSLGVLRLRKVVALLGMSNPPATVMPILPEAGHLQRKKNLEHRGWEESDAAKRDLI